ncbi:Serine-threonine/tyrosine-protein kinase, catalytic domain [Dillenia turbinata]|uniref:Serine-threonine/tyrosine-protein kinase, catalytic domain n=1 Tax=Dillenia turbinata TaxID=194707 RepID=A0AAN8ZUU1_9MAGN
MPHLQTQPCISNEEREGAVSNRKDAFLITTDKLFEQSMNHVQELSILKLDMLATATNNFDEANKLGQGGFGDVYRGKVPKGQDIAVKRLSRASPQGIDEFINEVVVISKLQYRNPVKLLGCCVVGEEKISKKAVMIALEEAFQPLPSRDSLLKIIHRDLKESNILLDEDLNPKISHFSTARMSGCNEDQTNTRRVFGT